MQVAARACLADGLVGVMNFLNEAKLRYPEAISFAAGRPSEHLFGVGRELPRIGDYARWSAERASAPVTPTLDALGQYGSTNGIVLDLLTEHLARDEGIHVPPEAVMVTTGCQEAMLVCLLGLVDPGRDALLVTNPSYVGITGIARLLGVTVVPVQAGRSGLEPAALFEAIDQARRRGRRPRALYDVPDFNNPLGSSLPLDRRREILKIAAGHGMLVLEDGTYRLFSYDEPAPPSLKALDEHGVVIYLGSFSKAVFPGLRIGYLVADQEAAGADAGCRLAQVLSRVKSFTTVNTSPLLQALVAEILRAHGGSLRGYVAERLRHYRDNRDRMLARLESGLRGLASDGVAWNRPRGGFFLTLSLPFEFGQAEVETLARGYGVLACPMSFLSLTPGWEREMRLSFSDVRADEIDAGVERLARFIHDRLAS